MGVKIRLGNRKNKRVNKAEKGEYSNPTTHLVRQGAKKIAGSHGEVALSIHLPVENRIKI